ncbi:hypothetical protein [Nocardia fluminea]|uniref:hypothetical protein n=1 Tax=Nocardia fluminea TaxID=134984 RepID=UPI003D137212
MTELVVAGSSAVVLVLGWFRYMPQISRRIKVRSRTDIVFYATDGEEIMRLSFGRPGSDPRRNRKKND